MGRFASTVALYEELRPPYPEEFFRTVALRLKLSKQHALIDLGTGPGLLALGFAPHVGRIVGVDPEPDMLAAAIRAGCDEPTRVLYAQRGAERVNDYSVRSSVERYWDTIVPFTLSALDHSGPDS